MELQLVNQLVKYDVYKEFNDYVTKDLFSSVDGSDKRKWLYHIYQTIDKFYQKHEEPLTLEALYKLHMASVQGSSVQVQEQYKEAFKQLSEDTGQAAAKELLIGLKKNALVAEAQDLMDEGNFDAAKGLINDIESLDANEDNFDCIDLGEMEDEIARSSKWSWITPKLNEATNGFGIERAALVFARPDGGKTSFTVANAVNMLNQGAKVLHYCISEDTKVKLLERYAQAAFGVDDTTLASNRKKYGSMFKERYGNLLFMRNVPTLNLAGARKDIEDCRPDVVIYDQYQKVQVYNKREMTNDAHLALIVQKLKELAKEYEHGIICVSQAGADGESKGKEGKRPKKYLDMSDLYGSNTLVQGEFQIIFGIGQDGNGKKAVHNPNWEEGMPAEDEYIEALPRYINLCKNKGAYGSVTMYLEPTTCKWIDG